MPLTLSSLPADTVAACLPHISPLTYDFSPPHLHPPAAKFTRSGTITVTGGISENGKHIFLAVEDTGVGIPKDKFGQIFGAFKQVQQRRYAWCGPAADIESVHHFYVERVRLF